MKEHLYKNGREVIHSDNNCLGAVEIFDENYAICTSCNTEGYAKENTEYVLPESENPESWKNVMFVTFDRIIKSQSSL
jgi:hypothetical protein